MRIHNLSGKYNAYFSDAGKSTWRLGVNVWHQFIAHKCLQQASSLAFNTLLCFVPLSAVALFFLKTFGVVEDGNSPLIVALRDNFLPRYGAEEIVAELSAFANRNLGGLGVYGFLTFLLVSTLLFMSVEQHFNDIWGARRRLPVVQAIQKYAVFYTLLSVGPLLIWFFFSTATNWVFAYMFPGVLVYCVFFLMYIAMPNTVVKRRAALLGALVSGTLFHPARLGFERYLELVWQNYSDIYGALAMLVIFALWTYVTWVVILLGAEVSRALHHLKEEGTSGLETRGYLSTTGVIALFLIVAERFKRGGGACPVSEISERSGISTEVVHQSFEHFKAAGLVYEVEGDTAGYLPARALADITLASLVEAVETERAIAVMTGQLASDSGARVLETFHRSQREQLEGVTVESLL